VDLEILTDRPERKRDCPACNWTVLDQDEPGPHTCRTEPSIPRTTIEEQRRASASILLEEELRIRNRRMAELGRARIR
jgi:hypothetical protein